MPISLGIAVLIAIVVSSYRQTILAYPSAGGAYIVSRENLGVYPSLVAGAALLTDYVLTVSVSVAAGIAAVTSAVPALYPYRVELCILGVLAITVANLRGVRESGRVFAVPTYAFIASYVLMIGWGARRLGASDPGGAPAGVMAESRSPVASELTLFLILRAFASGCVALTGIEAVSNGVPAFRPPEAKNARQVLVLLGVVLISLFVGITFLANGFGLTPTAQETINSQLARRVFGGGSVLYYLVQALTTLILIIAANTSFADFPRLSSFMARDRFMPRQFASRGDRLAFSNGIIILAVLSALLLVVFHAETHALIPLYAIGVFVSFTLSQLGMVRFWFRERGPRWPMRAVLNGTGRGDDRRRRADHRHDQVHAWRLARDPAHPAPGAPPRDHPSPLRRRRGPAVPRRAGAAGAASRTPPRARADRRRSPRRRWERSGTLGPCRRARERSTSRSTPRAGVRLEERWAKWASGMPLVVLRSPYRSVIGPLLDYVDRLQQEAPDSIVTIVLPEFVPVRWWQQLLHNQTALLIKGAMLFRRGVIVIDVPYHLAAKTRGADGPSRGQSGASRPRETRESPSARLQA